MMNKDYTTKIVNKRSKCNFNLEEKQKYYLQ